MGFINDVKKILFGAESVTKSAAGKASERGREASERLSRKAEEYAEKAKETSQEVGEEVLKKADEFWKRTQEVAEDIGEEVLKRSKPYTDKAKQFMEEREKRHGQEQPWTSQQKTSTPPPPKQEDSEEDWASDIVNDAFNEPDDIAKQAGEKVKDSGEKLDDILDEAARMSEELDKKMQDKKKQDDPKKEEEESAGSSRTVGYDKLKGSLLDGQDDFFSKAQRYAEGDYHNTGRKKDEEEAKEGEVKITQNPDFKKEEREGTVYGFEDLDGDGNELIDDAIIIKDDEEEDDDDRKA